MYKFAIQFYLDVLSDTEREAQDSCIVSECHWLCDTFEFEYDYWEWFNDISNTPELAGLKSGIYSVYQQGTASEEWSENWEYGREFDGFIFEPEITVISFVDRLPEGEEDGSVHW